MVKRLRKHAVRMVGVGSLLVALVFTPAMANADVADVIIPTSVCTACTMCLAMCTFTLGLGCLTCTVPCIGCPLSIP